MAQPAACANSRPLRFEKCFDSSIWHQHGPSRGIDRTCWVRLEALRSRPRAVARGDRLFSTGDRLAALYEVHTGFFKTAVGAAGGRCQIVGFQMSGDWLGLDGIETDRHGCDAVALEDSLVSEMVYPEFTQLLHDSPGLQREFHRTLSREIVRSQTMMLVLGNLGAEERLATFLLDLTQRLHDRGFAADALVLRMSREEIGSYLGLQIETVSRAFTRLQGDGVLKVSQRNVQILDTRALQRITEGTAA